MVNCRFSALCKWLNNRLGEYVFSVEYDPSRVQCKQKRVDTEFPLTDTWGAELSEHARFIYNATLREEKRYFMILLIWNNRLHSCLCTFCALVLLVLFSFCRVQRLFKKLSWEEIANSSHLIFSKLLHSHFNDLTLCFMWVKFISA